MKTRPQSCVVRSHWGACMHTALPHHGEGHKGGLHDAMGMWGADRVQGVKRCFMLVAGLMFKS